MSARRWFILVATLLGEFAFASYFVPSLIWLGCVVIATILIILAVRYLHKGWLTFVTMSVYLALDSAVCISIAHRAALAALPGGETIAFWVTHILVAPLLLGTYYLFFWKSIWFVGVKHKACVRVFDTLQDWTQFENTACWIPWPFKLWQIDARPRVTNLSYNEKDPKNPLKEIIVQCKDKIRVYIKEISLFWEITNAYTAMKLTTKSIHEAYQRAGEQALRQLASGMDSSEFVLDEHDTAKHDDLAKKLGDIVKDFIGSDLGIASSFKGPKIGQMHSDEAVLKAAADEAAEVIRSKMQNQDMDSQIERAEKMAKKLSISLSEAHLRVMAQEGILKKEILEHVMSNKTDQDVSLINGQPVLKAPGQGKTDSNTNDKNDPRNVIIVTTAVRDFSDREGRADESGGVKSIDKRSGR